MLQKPWEKPLKTTGMRIYFATIIDLVPRVGFLPSSKGPNVGICVNALASPWGICNTFFFWKKKKDKCLTNAPPPPRGEEGVHRLELTEPLRERVL